MSRPRARKSPGFKNLGVGRIQRRGARMVKMVVDILSGPATEVIPPLKSNEPLHIIND